MNKETTKKIAFAIGIVVIVLSAICFIWATYQAIGYGYNLQALSQQADDVATFKIFYALHIVISIFSLLLLSGCVLLFTYFYKKNSENLKNKD